MLKKSFLFLFLTCLFSAVQLHAQYDDLLRNPKISWVAEYTCDYELNPVYGNQLDAEYNLLEMIRLSNTSQSNGLYGDADWDYPFYLSQKIQTGLAEGQYVCFADSTLTRPLTAGQTGERLGRLDSLPGGEEKYKTLLIFRVRQVLYYNHSNRALGARLLAMAPVVYIPDNAGNWLRDEPLLWIKIQEYDKKQRRGLLQNATYVWQTRMKDNAPRVEDLLVKKGWPDFRQWAKDEVRSPSHTCLSQDTYQPLDGAALRSLVFTSEMLTRLNDEGVSEPQQIVQKDATDQVERLRLVQHWYFDAAGGRLYCEVRAVAPLAAVRSAEGEFRYEKPLFYVKY